MYKSILSALSGCIIMLTATAQKDAGIKALLSASGELILPVSVKQVTQQLKIKPAIVSEETMGDDYTWTTPNGLSIGTMPDADNKCQDLYMSAEHGEVLSGLPYGLVLNGSTLKDCETRFKSSIVEKAQLYSMDHPNEKSGCVLKLKQGKYYMHLTFNQQNRLEEIHIATFNIDAAG
jgi:hypothetical protein